MITLKQALLIFISFYILLSDFIVLSKTRKIKRSKNRRSGISSTNFTDPYRFQDPLLAYQILQQLDIFEEENISHNKRSKKPVMSMIPDDEYCEKHRAHITSHPETIFEQKNIVTSLIRDSLLRRRVIPVIGNDIHPNMPKRGQLIEVSPQVTAYFSAINLYQYRRIGKQFSCLTQVSSALPGHSHLYRKDYSAEALVEYAESYKDRPQCFNFENFFPRTWVLYEEEQCRDFFNIFNSDEYQKLKNEKGIIYIRKKGALVHKGAGVSPFTPEEENSLRVLYGNGTQCGKQKKNYIIQDFIRNPLLINGRKFDFRVYLLIASSNPVMAYFYDDGQLRISLHQYASNSSTKAALLTNVALSRSLFKFARKNGTYNGMTAKELKESHIWTFNRLQGYLLEKGIISDENWLDNYLRPTFRQAAIHLIRMSQEYFITKSSVYHLFGLDFMLDTNLNLWFLESNAKPALEGHSQENKEMKSKMLVDHFEIVYGLLRSRMKRIIGFVNEIIMKKDFRIDSPEELVISDLKGKRGKFKAITMNYFETEFEPGVENGWKPIIDENKTGKDRYFGMIKEDCI